MNSVQTCVAESQHRAKLNPATGSRRRIRKYDSDESDSLWLYRDRTVALLRRYLRMSVEVGRLPSLLGREFFRGKVTSYRASTFEDVVIFVHDVERSLDGLDGFDKELIATIVLREFSQKEAAKVLGCGYRTISRHYPESLDHVSEIFLKRGILERLPGGTSEDESCQEAGSDDVSLSTSIADK